MWTAFRLLPFPSEVCHATGACGGFGSDLALRDCVERVCFTPNFKHASGHRFALIRAISDQTSEFILQEGEHSRARCRQLFFR